MFKIRVTTAENTALYTDSSVSIAKGEIKEVVLSQSIIKALQKGILIKVQD